MSSTIADNGLNMPEQPIVSPANGMSEPARASGSPSLLANKSHNGAHVDKSHRRSFKIKYKALGQKDKIINKTDKIKSKTKPPGGFDPTPFPDAPPGFTIRFVFHRAANLPPADFQSWATDPYIHATLTATVPKRHKEDPHLVHRTKTIRQSTEPVWDEEWIVANVPPSGFTLKCRLYDEDWSNQDDRLGNATIKVPLVNEKWQGFGGDEGYDLLVKKRAGSKRAYLLKSIATVMTKDGDITPHLFVSAKVVGKSNPPHAQMYTVGPTTWTKHYSPMIGRLMGIKVNQDDDKDASSQKQPDGMQTKRYDFQANEIQMAGPVPPKLYHRFVEFRHVVGLMFSSQGFRGHILNKALHKQHSRIYNYDSTTEYGSFLMCSEEASLQFLRMAHFDDGGRIFTYVITLDGLLRFTETGREFGIDLLSKHTMHSDVTAYIAFSGEFFIRRLKHPVASTDPDQDQPTHPCDTVAGGSSTEQSLPNPRHYQLIIDNESGTYRPDKSLLPELKGFLERQFPGLVVIAMHWEDPELQRLKKQQFEIKKKEGRGHLHLVLNRSPRSSSFSSSDEGRLDDLERAGTEEHRVKSKKERAYSVLQNPKEIKNLIFGAQSDGGSHEARTDVPAQSIEETEKAEEHSEATRKIH